MGMTDIEKRALKRGAALPELSELPVRVPRDVAAALVTKYFFKTSPRTMERWPVTWRQLNGRAHAETAEIFEHATSVLEAAPVVMAGRRSAQRKLTT